MQISEHGLNLDLFQNKIVKSVYKGHSRLHF